VSSKTERFYGIDSAAEHGAQDWLTAMARVIAAVRRMMARLRARTRLTLMLKIIINKYRHQAFRLALAGR